MSLTPPVPIALERRRPIEPPPSSPYSQCGQCLYVGSDVQLGDKCPKCGTYLSALSAWPEPQHEELWHDEVFCWNHEKVELATIVAAMHFEAMLFNMIYCGLRWLDPKLSTIGSSFGEYPKKEERIWRFLESVRSPKATEKVLRRVFGVGLKQMLQQVCGDDADPFWQNYRMCAEWRNQIVHRGRRIYYETVPARQQNRAEPVKERTLWASLNFVPQCWFVFSELWNEYIHRPMLARNKSEGQKAIRKDKSA